jgi:fructokinase
MILCCGEALIDFVPRPGLGAYQPCPGGSVYNVAVGLGRLEVPVSFYCKVSTDFFGEMLVEYLEDNNVATDYCPRTSRPTTLAFVSLPNTDKSEPQFAFYANGSADRSLRVDELLHRLPEKIKGLHFGSISLAMEPGATALETLMMRESSDRVISLDPNVRPNLIPKRSAYRQRFEQWVSSVDILKLSHTDMCWIYPDTEFQECLECWFNLGARVVFLTKGRNGAEGYSSSGFSASVKTPLVEVADTIGAGDAFLAAILAFLYEGKLMEKTTLGQLSTKQLSDCLAYANRAAAINCSRVGASPAYRHELTEFDE